MATDAVVLDLHRRHVNPFWADFVSAIGLPVSGLTAEGSWLVTPDGSGILDMVACFGAAVLGHNPPGVLVALQKALAANRPMTALLGVVPEAGELAQRLLCLAGHGLSKVHFASGGAEAVDTALKLAAARTRRRRFISVDGGFHGLSVGATGLAGHDLWRHPFPHLWLDTVRVAPNDIVALERELSARDVAGVVLEIVPGSSAAPGWTAQALGQATELCRAAGSLLVVDEVQTAFGRLGRWFAFQGAAPDFRPDIVVVSKALSAGVIPVAAVLMTDEVFAATFGEPGQAKIHGSTMAGNRIAMSCGLVDST